AGRLARAAGLFALGLGVGPLATLEQSGPLDLKPVKADPDNPQTVIIPAHDANRPNPPTGVLRFSFGEAPDGRDAVGPKRLKATVITRAQNSPVRRLNLEIPVFIVPPVMLAPLDRGKPHATEVSVGEVRQGGERTVEFYCFSATRPDFTVRE